MANSDELYPQVLAAFERADALWGYDPASRRALPRAVQLQGHIERGEGYCRTHPHDVQAKIALLKLKQAYTAALADPEDERRCDAWRAAYGQFEALLAQYREAYHAEHNN